MIITKIADVADMEPGTNLECVRVKVLKAFKRKSGEGKYGPWSFQNLKVEDSSGQAEIILNGWDDFGSDTIGQTYAFSANSKGKGLEVVENEYGDKRPRLKIHKSADCALGTGQTAAEAEQPQAPKTPPTPPPAQAPKAPAQPAPQPPPPPAPPRPAAAPQSRSDVYASAPPNALPLRRRLHRLARLYLHAMNSADYVVKSRLAAGGMVQPDDHRHITTTLFIESNRKEWYGLVPDLEPNVAPALREVPPPPPAPQDTPDDGDRNYETRHAAGSAEVDDIPF